MAPSGIASGLDPSRCSAFWADDAPVEVVPAFDLDRTVPLFSASTVGMGDNGGAARKSLGNSGSGRGSRSDAFDGDGLDGPSNTSTSASTVAPFGPIKAGIPCVLPLWLAVALSEKSLAKISKPRWMETDNLVHILQEERTSPTLVVVPKSSSSHLVPLPFYYYEISQRLSKLSSVGWNRPEIRLLVEDIAQVRVDKLRHTFQKSLAGLASSSSSDAAVSALRKQLGGANDGGSTPSSFAKARLLPDTFADVTGICAMELAVLGPFFIQALNDVQQMEGRRQQQHKHEGTEDPQLSSARGGSDDRATSASSSSPPPPPRRRDRLRRFR
jgi:GINS complex protein